MSNTITLPVIVSSISSKVDGSVKISLETRELPADEAANLFAIRNQEAWAVLSPSQLEEVSIPSEKPDPLLNHKTPAQRLRSVIYILWRDKGAQGVFEEYYNARMESIIEQLKERIE